MRVFRIILSFLSLRESLPVSRVIPDRELDHDRESNPRGRAAA